MDGMISTTSKLDPAAPPPSPEEQAEAELRALLVPYGDGRIDDMRVRIAIDGVAKRYGLSPATLRGAFYAEAKKLRATGGSAGPAGAQDAAAASDEVQPATNPKSLDHLLDVVRMVISRQIWCSDPAADAVTLWIVGTYGYQAADVFPRLAITSEMRRCGKTTLLGTILHLAFQPELADNISPAAMFRLIAAKPLTLLIDEVDSFGRDDSGLRNILNAGYACKGAVKRVEPTPDGKGWTVVNFPCYCPVAIAGIGGLPDTVIDRSVLIRLQRAPRADAERQRRLRLRELRRYRSAIVPHLLAHGEAIRAALEAGAVKLPNNLNDRALDNWEPLLAVAELAGGDWPVRAMEAAATLSGTADDRRGLVEKLLTDIREIVEAPRRHTIAAWRSWVAAGRTGPRPAFLRPAHRPSAIRSGELLAGLLDMTHRPWSDASRGRPITERWLADRLRGLGVMPGRGRVPEWQYDANGEPGTLIPASTAAVLQRGLPLLRTYATAELRAAWKRCL